MSQSHINQPYCLWKLFTMKVNFLTRLSKVSDTITHVSITFCSHNQNEGGGGKRYYG